LQRIPILAVVLVLVLTIPSAWAAEKSVTLTVPGMTCPTCPVTLKKSLLKEQGVSAVKVLYEKKQLVVAYADANTTPAAITRVTAAVGFPAKIAD
jgi:mercuric ion binding protein